MIISGLLRGFDNWVTEKFQPTSQVRVRDVIREIPRLSPNLAKKVYSGIKPTIQPVIERKQAIERSIQTRSFQPLKQSFRAQGQELASQFQINSTDTPEQKIAKSTNLALSFSGGGIGKPTGKIAPRTLRNFIQPVETVIGKMGDSGAKLSKLLTTTADKGEIEAAKRVNQFVKSQAAKLTREEKFNLHDVLHGKAEPLNDTVDKVFQITRKITDELGKQAQDIGVQVRRKMTIKPQEVADPLATEARKYKSAEEFVKAQQPRVGGIAPELKGETLYRGMSESEWKAIQDGGLSGKRGDGRTYLTTEKETAQMAVDEGVKSGKGEGVIVELKPEAGQKVISGGKIGENTGGNLRGEYQGKDIGIDDIARVTDSKGNVIYEASTGGKTKSQLTDIWNKAGKSELPTGLTSLQRQHLNEGKEITGRFKVPFEPRENYYPHGQVFPDALKKGEVRKDIAENLVRQGIKPDLQEANKFIDDFREFIESGKRQDSLINYMVDTGQSKDAAEALSNLQRFRTRTIKRSGSLEFSREVDLPFYDPDPSRALPSFIESSSKKLEQIKAFGQDNKIINQLILDIRNGGGDADLARAATDRVLGMINDANTPAAKASRFLRAYQGFKLGLAAIPNSTQGILNSLLYADLRAVAAGVRGVLTKSGREYALQSGARLETVVREAAKESGALSTFLKYTGFNTTEQLNRTIASNAGRSYGQRLFDGLLKNPNKSRAARILQELGVDTKKALEAGQLSEDDILMMGKKFSDITQFRSRPQDLPLFASTNVGKIFFQFKSFIYGQTRLLHKATIQEFKNGNFGRGTRNLLILGTIFPITGEIVADIRAIITGRKRESKGLERYFEDIAQVGALGILSDTLQSGSYGKGVETLAGPTLSEAGQLVNIAGGDNKFKNVTKYITKKIPILGSRITNALFPKETSTKTKLKKKKIK